MKKKKDSIFKKKRSSIEKFEFNQEVVDVFDDMIARSVPFYAEIHRIINDLLPYYLKDGDTVYDIGCSTGSTLVLIDRFAKQKKIKVNIVGIDSSPQMIERCREKMNGLGVRCTLHCADATKFPFKKNALVIMNYTLQFIPPIKRQKLLATIYNSLRPQGLFLLSEKIKSDDEKMQKLITDMYYDFKRRNGYSELEISQKRESLENVLIPCTSEKQIQQLKKAGFEHSEMIFRWYNFASYLGMK